MDQQNNTKFNISKMSINSKNIFILLGIVALNILLIIPVGIPLIVSSYVIIGCFYIASVLLLLSPVILIIHHVFPQLPISFGLGTPAIIVELLIIMLLFIIGLIMFKTLRKISLYFHLKVKKQSTKLIKWNLSYIKG